MSYFINVCGNIDDVKAPQDCNKKAQLCMGNNPLHVQSRTFYYEGMFHLYTSAIKNYTKIFYSEFIDTRHGPLQIRESN